MSKGKSMFHFSFHRKTDNCKALEQFQLDCKTNVVLGKDEKHIKGTILLLSCW